MHRKRRLGFSLIEVMMVVALVGVVAGMAAPAIGRWRGDQRLKAAARSAAHALTLARSEAIRTGNNHIVFFQADAQGNTLFAADGTAVPILVVDDSRPGDPLQNCLVDAGEAVEAVLAESGVNWGIANATGRVPSDSGTGAIASGSSFTDPGDNAATWVLFRPQGTPAGFDAGCAIGGVGSGAGAVYVTNGNRDYAVVVTPLGGVRVHGWDGAAGQWSD